VFISLLESADVDLVFAACSSSIGVAGVLTAALVSL